MMRLHRIVVDRCFFERLCTDAPAPPAAGAKEFRLRRVGHNTLSAIMRLGRAKAGQGIGGHSIQERFATGDAQLRFQVISFFFNVEFMSGVNVCILYASCILRQWLTNWVQNN